MGLVAPLVIDGPINGELFRAWVEQMLVPALQPGDLVVLDNLHGTKLPVWKKRAALQVTTCSTYRRTVRITWSSDT